MRTTCGDRGAAGAPAPGPVLEEPASDTDTATIQHPLSALFLIQDFGGGGIQKKGYVVLKTVLKKFGLES